MADKEVKDASPGILTATQHEIKQHQNKQQEENKTDKFIHHTSCIHSSFNTVFAWHFRQFVPVYNYQEMLQINNFNYNCTITLHLATSTS
jgi:hypothetical protein